MKEYTAGNIIDNLYHVFKSDDEKLEIGFDDLMFLLSKV
jgi:hypothetical protein